MAQSPLVDSIGAIGATPVAFGPAERALLGFYHPPEGSAQGIGVVLCNPLGYDAMCTHRAYRHLAERLAARGVPALRFDYYGSGDSAGEPTEAHRVDAWLESIDAAVNELRQRAGVGFVALFGVRSGALLAVASAKRNNVEALALWAPVASGREFVRELRAFRLIKRQGDGIALAPRSGGEEAAGYFFDKETVTSLAAIDPLRRNEHVARRALFVPRDDLPGNEGALAAHLEKCGAEVRTSVEPGYAGMMRDPQDSVVPSATLEKIIDWLVEPNYPRARPRAAADTAPAVFTAAGPAHKGTVREHAVQFGAGRRLFGIVTEPVERSVPAYRPALVFLNVGANHRVGPNRMYVAMARDLAAQGFTCFRFDVGGLGDSKIAPGARENRLYSKDSVGDVKSAMTLLRETRHAARFVLIGLCSGAYLAFHTCVEDPRVVGQVLINPQTFEWKEGDTLELSTRNSFHSTRYYLRSLISPVTWKRTLKGEVHVKKVAQVLRQRLVARTSILVKNLAARVRSQSEPLTEVARAFRTMSDRDVQSLLVFSFMDGGLDMIEKHLGSEARKMRGRANFRLRIIDGADHTFTPLDSQTKVHDLILKDLISRFP